MGLLRRLLSFYQTPVEHARGEWLLDLPTCWNQSHGAEQTNIQDRNCGCLPLSCFLTSCTRVKMHVMTKTLSVLSRQGAHLLHSVLHWHAAQSKHREDFQYSTAILGRHGWYCARLYISNKWPGRRTPPCEDSRLLFQRSSIELSTVTSQRGFLLPSHLFKMYSLALYHPCLPSIAVRH